MAKEIINDAIEVTNAHKQLIKINKYKIPEDYCLFDDDYYDDTIEQFKGYRGDSLYMKYYSLVESVGKFINKYNIDISCIKKSTINKINEHQRLDALKKVVYSEPEDELEDKSEDEPENETDNESEDKIPDDETSKNNVKEQYRLCQLKNNRLNEEANNSTVYNLLNNIIAILQDAIKK